MRVETGLLDAAEPLYSAHDARSTDVGKFRGRTRPAVLAATIAVATLLAAVATLWSTSASSGLVPIVLAVSDEGTCVNSKGELPEDCEHVDYGTCGASCCAVEVAVPGIDPIDAYDRLSKALSNGGPDGRYSKDNSKDDVQNEIPFSYSPPLPWRFTMSGRHTTAESCNSAGACTAGFADTLRVSVGVSSSGGDLAMTRVRMFSMSGPSSALVDRGQGFKNLAFLSRSLGWPAPSPTFGCGLGQAVLWVPTNSPTIALQNRDGVCLDALQRNKNGGRLQTWNCDVDNLNQMWQLDSESGLIKNADGVCLTDMSADGPGALVTWACDQQSKLQQWDYDEGAGQIKARKSGFCVDAADRKTNGGKVSMWRCDPNNPNQQWDTRKRKRDE